jgi:hypothetical protein
MILRLQDPQSRARYALCFPRWFSFFIFLIL